MIIEGGDAAAKLNSRGAFAFCCLLSHFPVAKSNTPAFLHVDDLSKPMDLSVFTTAASELPSREGCSSKAVYTESVERPSVKSLHKGRLESENRKRFSSRYDDAWIGSLIQH